MVQSKKEKEEVINTAIAKAEMLYMGVNVDNFIIVPLTFTGGVSLKYMCNGKTYTSSIEHASFSYFEEQ